MTRVKDDVVLVKEALKWSLQGLLAKELGGVPVSSRVTTPRHPYSRSMSTSTAALDNGLDYIYLFASS